ncbi:hypothetical protein GCM10008997_38300 [Halomonas salifodinae]
MSNPTLDAAISLLKSAASQRGAESIMTTDPDGNTLILIGAGEPDKTGRLAACQIELASKEESC